MSQHLGSARSIDQREATVTKTSLEDQLSTAYKVSTVASKHPARLTINGSRPRQIWPRNIPDDIP